MGFSTRNTVDAQFKCVMGNLNSTDARMVGMYEKYFDECAINKEYVIKCGNASMGNLT